MSIRKQALQNAKGEEGYAEKGGNNDNKYGEWYGMNYQPWCAMFCTWAAVNAGSKALARSTRYSYVPYVEQDAVAGRNGLEKIGKTNGKPGDLITFNFDPDSTPEHIGMVIEHLGGGDYKTIEGNTSDGSYANGGEVMKRTRYASQVSMIVRYPDSEEEEDDMALEQGDSGNAVKYAQVALNNWSAETDKGWKISADGSFGPGMTDRVKEFQKAHQLEQSGRLDGVSLAYLMRWNQPQYWE